MSTRRIRFFWQCTVAGALSLPLLLTACGGGSDPTDPPRDSQPSIQEFDAPADVDQPSGVKSIPRRSARDRYGKIVEIAEP